MRMFKLRGARAVPPRATTAFAAAAMHKLWVERAADQTLVVAEIEIRPGQLGLTPHLEAQAQLVLALDHTRSGAVDHKKGRYTRLTRSIVEQLFAIGSLDRGIQVYAFGGTSAPVRWLGSLHNLQEAEAIVYSVATEALGSETRYTPVLQEIYRQRQGQRTVVLVLTDGDEDEEYQARNEVGNFLFQTARECGSEFFVVFVGVKASATMAALSRVDHQFEGTTLPDVCDVVTAEDFAAAPALIFAELQQTLLFVGEAAEVRVPGATLVGDYKRATAADGETYRGYLRLPVRIQMGCRLPGQPEQFTIQLAFTDRNGKRHPIEVSAGL